LKSLSDGAREFEFETHGYRSTVGDLARLPLPAILSWDPSHFVVLERVSKDSFTVIDPAEGRREVTGEEFEEKFTNFVLTVQRTDRSETIHRPKWTFFKYVWPHIPRSPIRLLLITLFAAGVFALGLVPPLLAKSLYDSADAGGPSGVIFLSLMFLPALGAAYFISNFGRARLTIWLETTMDLSLVGGFLSHLLTLPYSYFLTRRRGDILVRASSTSFVREVLSARLLGAMVDLIFVAGYFLVIAVMYPPYSYAVAALALAQVIVLTVFSPRLRLLSERELAEMSASQSVMLETLNAVETVKSSGLEKESYARWEKSYEKQLNASFARRKLDAVAIGFQSTISYLGPVGLTVLGVSLIAQGEISLGQAVALVSLAAAALGPVTTLGMSVQALQTIRVHIDRLSDVTEEISEDVNTGGLLLGTNFDLDLKDVEFRYGAKGNNILNKVNLHIDHSQHVAIIGASGSGKSTVARSIIGLLRPQVGNVLINGQDVNEYDLIALRRHCGIVTQNAEAVSGTIHSNIVFGREGISIEDVRHALWVANLDEDISKMPLGLNTPVGESGIGLSGGQLQRLSIARSIAGRPSILVLDEATSHLDAVSEQRVVSRLADLGCMRIVIAHRLSTIRQADRIFMMAEGRIEMSGTHNELIETPAYREFFENQLTESERL
jgi:ABC-type bacteriocin/lantibiotic exporter with double-glycine peptidase domain